MSFVLIPTRSNGQNVDASWWNSLAMAGIALESFVGAGFIGQTQVTIANTQATPANIAGLTFDHTVYSSIEVAYEIRRLTATNEEVAYGKLILFYRNLSGTWDFVDRFDGDNHGLTWSFSGSQLQYVSDTLSGTGYVGTMKFKASTFNT